MLIESVLTLSTAHVFEASKVPSGESLVLGTLRCHAHEHGWVVFVCAGTEEVLPDWFKPIHDAAEEANATLILFDGGVDISERFTDFDGLLHG